MNITQLTRTTAMAACLCLSLFTLNANAQQKGKFRFNEETHDFGQVYEGRTLDYDFNFSNVGNATLNILSSQCPANYIRISYARRDYPVNQRGTIHITFPTQGHLGAFNIPITIGNDGAQQPMTVYLKGTVVVPTAAPPKDGKPPVKPHL